MTLIKELDCAKAIADQIINSKYDLEYKEYILGNWRETYRVHNGFFKSTETLISKHDTDKGLRDTYDILYSEMSKWHQLNYEKAVKRRKTSSYSPSEICYECIEKIKVYTTSESLDKSNEKVKNYCNDFIEKILEYNIIQSIAEEISKISSVENLLVCVHNHYISLDNGGWDDNVSVRFSFSDFGYEQLRNKKEKMGIFVAVMENLRKISSKEVKWCYMTSWNGDEYFRLKIRELKEVPKLKPW